MADATLLWTLHAKLINELIWLESYKAAIDRCYTSFTSTTARAKMRTIRDKVQNQIDLVSTDKELVYGTATGTNPDNEFAGLTDDQVNVLIVESEDRLRLYYENDFDDKQALLNEEQTAREQETFLGYLEKKASQYAGPATIGIVLLIVLALAVAWAIK